MKTNVLDKLFQLVDRTDALIGRLIAICMYRNVGLVVLLTIYFIGMLTVTPFPRILREDAYVYVLKALEILNGDFTPPPSNHIGWPVMLAPVFALLQINDLFTAMFVARWLSFACVFGCFLVIYAICRRVIDGHNKYQIAAIVALCAFMSSIHCNFIVQSAMTEPAFLLFTMISIYFLVGARTTIKSVILASIFASLSYYVRPNGLFSIGVIVLFLLTRPELNKTIKVKFIFGAILVFFLVSAPHMINRYQAFGSAFSYGENSKIFVDNSTQLWAPSIKAPTFGEYVKTSSFADYYDKFIVKGLWQVLKLFYSAMLPKLWIIFFIASFLKTVFIVRDKKYDVFYIWILVSILGMSLVFHIFRSERHLIYLMPIILIVSVGFLSSMDRNSQVKFSNIVLFFILLFNLSWMPRALQPIPAGHLTIPEVRDNWAIWGAQHLEGKVAIVEGGDVLEIGQHYSEFNPERKIILPFDQVDRKISTIRPGNYARLKDALIEFEQLGIQYVITDGNHIKRRPYLKELQNEEWASQFRHLKYFRSRIKGSVLHDVNIYQVCYEGKCP
jgi:hypothetical protein